MITFIFSIHQKLRITISLIYLGIIIILSLMPAEDVPQITMFDGFDKLVHFCMYLGLTWLLCWTLHAEDKHYFHYYIIFLSVGWGILMEGFQLEMHLGRAFEWFDVLANATGALAGVLIYTIMVNRRKGHKLK